MLSSSLSFLLFVGALNAQFFHDLGPGGAQYDLGNICQTQFYEKTVNAGASSYAEQIINASNFDCFVFMQTESDPYHFHPGADDIFRIVRGRGYTRIGTDTSGDDPVESATGSITLIPKTVSHGLTNVGGGYTCIWACYSPTFDFADQASAPAHPGSVYQNSIPFGSANWFTSVGEAGRTNLWLIEYPCDGNLLANSSTITVVARGGCAFPNDLSFAHDEDVVVTVISGGLTLQLESGFTLGALPEDTLFIPSGTRYITPIVYPNTRVIFSYSSNPDGNYDGDTQGSWYSPANALVVNFLLVLSALFAMVLNM